MHPSRDIVVIGASAGGIAALQTLLGALPADFPAAVFVVLHRSAGPEITLDNQDSLPWVLTRCARLPGEAAADGRRIEPGHIYIAPRGIHLLLDRGVMRLESSPPEARSRSRPSIDVLFRSAAQSYGRRAIGVLLTGSLDDGVAGLWQIRRRGGSAMVQHPDEALYPSMPQSALNAVMVDHSLPLAGIADKLVQLVSRAEASSYGADRQPARILIAEDERLVALNLESRLQELGYEVVGSVSSGEAALESALLLAPDLVLMDIQLSGVMKGTEAARLLWQRDQVPSIFLTAFADQGVLDDARLANSYGYLVKPFRPAQVHAAIQMALARYEVEMCAPELSAES